MSILYEFENAAYNSGYELVAGVDEAGRGPLAGPVYAAAVILPRGCEIEGINDSKKLSAKTRERLFDVIIQKAVSYAICSCDEKEIDKINILQASMKAMSDAVSLLDPKPDIVLIDGNKAPIIPMDAKTIVKGDQKSASIAAASILAKVSRDRFMLELDNQYPQYKFYQHKGYPTKEHFDLIKIYGPSEVHRITFLKKFI